MKQKQFTPISTLPDAAFSNGNAAEYRDFLKSNALRKRQGAIVLTQRQQGLLRWLAENGGQYHSAATLAAAHGISVRTVKKRDRGDPPGN